MVNFRFATRQGKAVFQLTAGFRELCWRGTSQSRQRALQIALKWPQIRPMMVVLRADVRADGFTGSEVRQRLVRKLFDIVMSNLAHQHHSSPVLPTEGLAAMQLLEMFRDPDRDIDRIVEFIYNDPLLMAETLRRSNNGLFHGAEHTDDIFEAVSRLGFYELYDIIASSLHARSSVVGEV